MKKIGMKLLVTLCTILLVSCAVESDDLSAQIQTDAQSDSLYIKPISFDEFKKDLSSEKDLVSFIENSTINLLKDKTNTKTVLFNSRGINKYVKGKEHTVYTIPAYVANAKLDEIYNLSVEIVEGKTLPLIMNKVIIDDTGVKSASAWRVDINNTKSMTQRNSNFDIACVTILTDCTCHSVHASGGCTHPEETMVCSGGTSYAEPTGGNITYPSLPSSGGGATGGSGGYSTSSTATSFSSVRRITDMLSPEFPLGSLYETELTNSIFGDMILNYLLTNGNSYDNKLVAYSAIQAIEQGLLSNYYYSYSEYSNSISTLEKSLTPDQLNWKNNNELKYLLLSSNYINNPTPENLALAKWAVGFLMNNPNTTWQQFENWFMSKPEGTDEAISDEAYWNSSNLIVSKNTLPSFSNFKLHFPNMPSREVYDLVGGHMKKAHYEGNKNYQNACAIRGSRGLNYSGISIEVYKPDGINQKTEKGDDGKNYILDAVSFNKWANKSFTTLPVVLKGAEANDPSKVAEFLKGKNGIFTIVNNNASTAGYSGHIDLIENGICARGCNTLPTGGVSKIEIWILK